MTMDPETAMRPSILVVDDTLENLRLMAGMLADRGFDVRPVTSGRDALSAIEHELPDLVLLDVTMPEMDGFEVCGKLKDNPAWRDIPVIFLTALSELSDKVRGFEVGGADYITKPFQLEEVLARVNHHLSLQQARRDLSNSLTRLQGLERLRDDLVHMIVHDMRSPLSVLIINLGMIRADVTGEVQTSVDDAIQAARSLNRMASTLLDVSRLEAGKMPLNLAPCDVGKLAETARTALAALDPARSIELSCPTPVTVSCDGDLVRRVLENLISNGIKHTPTGGRLQIEVVALPGRVRVWVQDEGPGVPVEAQQRIFEKFGAAAARKDQTYHSVGLGLAFCKLAVEAHGGSIGVERVVPRGSRFWFELPA
jgi:signal transduction histidine kinase